MDVRKLSLEGGQISDHTEFMVVIGGWYRVGATSVISNGVRNPCLERSESSFGLRQERISPAGRNDRKNGRKDKKMVERTTLVCPSNQKTQ